jgi:predicted ATPase
MQIREGLAAAEAARTKLYGPLLLGALAQGYAQGGQVEEGLKVIAEALAMVEKNEERWSEAELYRLKGELLLAQEVKSQKSKGKSQKSKISSPQPLTHSTQAEVEQEAEECFLKAIAIAQKQQAKSLELRAVMSLARLRQHQAAQEELRPTHHETRMKLGEAHTMLSEIYNWFTEGFDTKDLREAKALLEELG